MGSGRSCDLDKKLSRCILLLVKPDTKAILEDVLLVHAAFKSALETMADHPFHIEAAIGSVENIRAYLQEDPELVNALDARSQSPLMLAAQLNNVPGLRCLLDHGAHINYCCADRGTALQNACLSGHAEAAALLLQRGADATIRNERAPSPLESAVMLNHIGIVDLLQQHGESVVDWGDVLRAVYLRYTYEKGLAAVMGHLLWAGADPVVDDVRAIQSDDETCRRFLQEWERAYCLTRARHVRDAHMAIATVARADICVDSLPPYMRDRVERGEDLPSVEVQKIAGIRGVQIQQQQQRGQDHNREEEEKEDKDLGGGSDGPTGPGEHAQELLGPHRFMFDGGVMAVVHAVSGLNGELFAELMQMVGVTEDG